MGWTVAGTLAVREYMYPEKVMISAAWMILNICVLAVVGASFFWNAAASCFHSFSAAP
jgi:hypothetical protein